MKEIYDRFAELLVSEDKAGTIRYALSLLTEERITVNDLYELILGPLLNAMHCPENDESCIWREHVRSSIVRAVVEVSYPYVLKAKEKPDFHAVGKCVLIVCPPEEYHEIGARMASDFFELAGFDAKYVGANTPNRDVMAAVRNLKPDYVAISVTNYYNLVKAKTTIESIRAEYPDIQIVLGGSAFRDPRHVKCVGCGQYVSTYAQVLALAAAVR